MLVCQGASAGLILGHFLKVKVYLSFDSALECVHEKLDDEEQRNQKGIETLTCYLELHFD